MSCGRSRRGAVALLLLVLGASTPSAQVAPALGGSAARPQPLPIAGPRSRPFDGTTAPAIVARAMPATFLIIAVPRPAALLAAAPLRYEVIGTGMGTIVGEREGTVAGDSLLITFGVPRTARAGRSTVAHVRFHAEGHGEVEVPLELDVGVVRRIALSLPRERQGVVVGGRLEIPVRVRNDGNALDSVIVHLELPADWRQGEPGRVIALAPGVAAEGRMRVTLPPTISPGTRRVVVVATNDAGERARALSLVEITDPRLSGRRAGARFTSGVATVLDGDGRASAVVALDLSGQLTDSVRVQGRLTSDPAPSAFALRGLSRVGYGGTPWYLVLDAPDWRADLGAVHVGYTPLTGVGATGNGGAFTIREGVWTGAILAAGPAPGLENVSADYVGARLERSVDSVRVGATITHLEERSEIGRALHAFGIDVRGPLAFGADVAGHLAWRDHRGGNGLGWHAEIARQSDRGNYLGLRATGAPGGSAAFARSARELSAVASRRVTRRAAIAGALWTAHDESALAQRVTMDGWSLAPRLLVSDGTSLSLEVAETGYESRSSVATFGSGERRAAVGADTHWRSFSASSRIQHGIVVRTVALSSGSAHRTSAGRTAWHGSVATSGRWGAADLTTRLEQNDAGAGYEPRRNEIQLRLQGPRIPVRGLEVMLRGELHHFGWFGDRASVDVTRLAADVDLPWSMRVTLDTERNPLFSTVGGSSVWNTAVRVTRSTTLPRLFIEQAAEGTVFQDMDANGRRDAGEPGLPSAVVRYGQSFAATDARGRYAFETRQGGAPQLDVRSIPLGWIVTGVGSDDDGRRTDIGVAPTSAVHVRLGADTAVQADLVARISWRLVRVTVRNAAGREWAAPVDDAGRAYFDAIPAGRYTISLDLSRLPEPMSVASGDTTFAIGVERADVERALVLRTRPIRVRRIGPASSGADTTRTLQPPPRTRDGGRFP